MSFKERLIDSIKICNDEYEERVGCGGFITAIAFLYMWSIFNDVLGLVNLWELIKKKFGRKKESED